MSGILHVCTGNLCRSPIAEVVTRAGLRDRFGAGPDLVPISSAGTEARNGRPMWPLAAEELSRRGLNGGRFVSTRLSTALVLEADLVLTATRAHRDAVLAETPRAFGRVFTWRELAWLLDGVDAGDVPGALPADRLAGLAAIGIGRRGSLAPPAPEDMDVTDPMGKEASQFEAAADLIVGALAPLVALL